ncbi:unnamed protein product [Rhodiola kirilowii]
MTMITEVMKKKDQDKEVLLTNGKVSKVTTLNTTFVKPAKRLIGKRECQLITFDLPYLAFFYNQKLMLYQGSDNFNDTVGKMKDGLATVLEEFYQLAGKLGKDDEGIFIVEFDEDEKDACRGVEVLEAVADEIGVNDVLVEEGSGGIMKDLLPYNGVLNLEGLHKPLLAIQKMYLVHFLLSLCAVHQAKRRDFPRVRLQPRNPRRNVHVALHELMGRDLPRGRNYIGTAIPQQTPSPITRVKLDLALPPTPIESESGAGPKLREKLFRFSESAVNAIKSKANAASTEGVDSSNFTTFQSITAHIWTHVTRARHLKPEDVTAFAIFADCRNRIDPPVPETYFGNMIQAIFTGTAAGLLLAHPLNFGAGVLQSAIKSHDANMINARNEAWEKSPIIFQYKDAGANCMAVGSSPRFKVYDIDFGFGKPLSVRSGRNNRFDGMVYLYPGKEGGRSIDVEISLEESAMAELEKDDEFLVMKN